MKHLLMTGIALLCVGQSENDWLNAQPLDQKPKHELELGVIGPAALAQQVQTDFHRLIRYFKPLGWSHQYPNDILANINVTAERQLASDGGTIEWIGGSELSAGTMMNSLTIYPLLRLGRMQEPPLSPEPYHPINNIVFASNFGAVASIGDVSISFNQNNSTAMMKGLYSHEVGNISLYFGW